MKQHPYLTFVGLILTCLVLLFLSISWGSVALSWQEIFAGLFDPQSLVFRYRLPRAALAFFVGASMALAGKILQSILHNPLASPSILGITQMGGLTTALMILWIPTFTPLSLSFFALLGCLLAGVLIYIFSSGQKTQLIMTGVAISTLSSALTGLLLIAFAPAAGEAMIWLKGSLYSRNLSHLQYFLPWSVLTLACAYYYHHQLDLLQLEEESATNLGVPVTYRRACLFALACLLTAGSVSVAGGLAFVGLIAPHIARWSSSPLHRFQLPLTLLSGAALVLACDLLGRTLFSPVEIPVGLVTAILGAPYFLYLLMTRSL